MFYIINLLAIAYLITSPFCFAQTKISINNKFKVNGYAPEGIKSIFCTANQHCVGVGDIQYGWNPDDPNSCPGMNCSKLIAYTSDDNGKTWQPAKFIPRMTGLWGNTFSKVDCGNDGLRCTAVGTEGFGQKFTGILILNSVDGGEKWQRVLQPKIPPSQDGHAHENLASVSCDTTGFRCVAVGDYYAGMNIPVEFPALALYTINGVIWNLPKKSLKPKGDVHTMQNVACDKLTMHCCASGFTDNDKPITYKTTDGGQTWE